MRWYKWTVQQFEGLNNMNNGNMIVMEKGYGGRYYILYVTNYTTKISLLEHPHSSNLCFGK